MTRTLTAGMQTAVAAHASEAAHLVVLAFSGGTVRFTDAAQDLLWDGNTYTALGGLLQFDVIQETSDFAAQGVGMKIDGVSTTVIDTLLSEGYIGRLATIYRCHFDAAGEIVADPVVLFIGYMNDAWQIEEKYSHDRSYCEVSTRFVSPLAKFEQVRGIRADLASHQRYFSTDTFFSHISSTTDRQVNWGIWRAIRSITSRRRQFERTRR